MCKFTINITRYSLKQLENASFWRVSERYTGGLVHSSFWSCCFMLWFIFHFFCFVLFCFLLFSCLLPSSSPMVSIHLCAKLTYLQRVSQHITSISSLWVGQTVVWAEQGHSLLWAGMSRGWTHPSKSLAKLKNNGSFSARNKFETFWPQQIKKELGWTGVSLHLYM